MPLPLERRTVTSRLCSGAATSLCTFAPWQASIEDYSAAEIGRLEAAAEVQSRAQHRRRLAPPQLSHAFAPQRAETRRRLAPPSPLPPSPRGACRGEEAAALLTVPLPLALALAPPLALASPTPDPEQAEEHEREEEMEVMIKWTIVLSLGALACTFIGGYLLELRHLPSPLEP